MDKKMLMNLQAGDAWNSLICLVIPKEVATTGGLEVLSNLNYRVFKNFREREQLVGQVKWQRHTFPSFFPQRDMTPVVKL